MSRLISPNDLQKAAMEAYCEGREPRNDEEWALCVNYWAANIASGMEDTACVLLGRIFECPLSAEYITEIAKFQAERK